MKKTRISFDNEEIVSKFYKDVKPKNTLSKQRLKWQKNKNGITNAVDVS